MARECEICGRTLRTGRKYCYEHRSQGYAKRPASSSEDNIFALLIGIVIIIMLLGAAMYFVVEWLKTHMWVFYSITGIIVLVLGFWVYINFIE